MTGYLIGGVVVELFGYTTAFLCCSFLYAFSGLLVQLIVKEDFVPPEKGAGKKKNNKLSRDILVPGVIAILVMFLLMGAGRRIDQPFVAMLVELINGEKGAAFYTGLISAGGAVGGVIAGFGFGYLSDRFRPEKMLPWIIVCAAVCAVWQGCSTSVWALVAGRFFYYFVAGGMQPLLLVMLSRLTSPENKGAFFGWSASVNTAGGVFSALVSGVIVFNWGVRAIFFAGGVLLISMLIPGWKIFLKGKKG